MLGNKRVRRDQSAEDESADNICERVGVLRLSHKTALKVIQIFIIFLPSRSPLGLMICALPQNWFAGNGTANSGRAFKSSSTKILIHDCAEPHQNEIVVRTSKAELRCKPYRVTLRHNLRVLGCADEFSRTAKQFAERVESKLRLIANENEIANQFEQISSCQGSRGEAYERETNF